MNTSIVILVVVVALVAWLMWSRRERSNRTVSAPAALPAGAGAPAAPVEAAGIPGSYDEYRRLSPSNMVYGKLTCNRCGSNLIAASGGVASCSNCGAALYRA